MALRIDAHQHFWRYDRERLPWIGDAMPALGRDFLPEDLQPLLAASGFTGCIVVQAQQHAAETAWLLQLAQRYPFIRGVVGWVDLCAANVTDQLAALAAHRRLCGVRHIVQDEPDDRFMLRPDFLRGIAALSAAGLTYDILVFARQLPAAIELVRRFPEQRFVVDHIAKPEIRTRRLEPWKQHLGTLAAHPNVFCKLSGMLTEADWRKWRAGDFTAYLDIALACFGPARLMIGSDWPVCLLAGTYADAVAVVMEYIGRLARDEQTGILGDNAARFYALGDA